MPKPNARPHGQVRYSQVVTTFGPGSLLDLPTQSVIVGGLEHWTSVNEEVLEPRLVEKLKRLLNLPTLKLYSPPPDNEDSAAPKTGITAWQFPEWFITQDVERGAPLHLAYPAHQGGGGSRRPDAADCGAAVIELAAPGLVSPRVRALARSRLNPRSSPLRLTRWTARCSDCSTWG
jgi:hypothetical protein